MWSPGCLKVINTDSSQVLQELIADCQNVSFSPSSVDGELLLLGYWDSSLCLLPISNPEKAQLIPLNETIVSCQWCPSGNGAYVTLKTDQVVVISKLNKQWSLAAQYKFKFLEGQLIECFPLSTGALIFIRVSNHLVVGLSENPPEWQQIALIDCFENTGSVHVSSLPSSQPNCCAVLIGTEDGHVYRIKLKNPNPTLVCDIQQPVASLLNVDGQIIVVGKYGKTALLDNPSKEALISFAPTTISNCCNFGRQLYFMGSDQLYSMEFTPTNDIGFLGEANYCKVKFVRAFQLKGETVVILTENGTVYQSSLVFEYQKGTRTRQRSGTEIKPILSEIHRCTDQIKALNSVSERVRLDVAQLSIALHMLSQVIGDRFPIIVRCFTDPNSLGTQRVIISVTNNSTWNLSSSHWAFQICANQTDQTCNLLRQDWRIGETIELEHRLPLSDDAFDVEVKISLVFRVIDPRKQSESQSLSVFPLSAVELTVLDFLEPVVSDHFDVKNNLVDVVGFCRKKVNGSPWPIILQRSWHRGFANLLGEATPPLQTVLLCGSYSVRMTLKEDENYSDKIWTLRIETSNSKLLRLLRTEIFRLIEARNPPPTSDVIRVPSYVLAHLQSLRGRLNYIQSLSQWDETDVEPLMEEIRLVMAKQFPIR